MPSTPSARPDRAVTQMTMENSRSACFLSPSPIVLPMRALPPVPTMKPKAESAMSTGKMRLSAAKAFLPTQLETKKPSTML